MRAGAIAHQPGAEERTLAVRASDRAAAVLAALAGGLHLVLLREHLAQNLLFGGVFTSIAAFQLLLGLALWRRPTTLAREVGRWGSLLIVVIFLGARLVVPPGGDRPESVSALGVLSLVLELSEVGALSIGLGLPARRARGFPWTPALAAGLTFLLVELLATGALTNLRHTSPLGTTAYLVPPYRWTHLAIAPALGILVGGHWFLYLAALPTALILTVAALLVAAVGLTIQVSAADLYCTARFGLVGAAPAILAAPICCAPSRLASFGAVAAASLGSVALPLLSLSALLLYVDVTWLRLLLRAGSGRGAH